MNLKNIFRMFNRSKKTSDEIITGEVNNVIEANKEIVAEKNENEEAEHAGEIKTGKKEKFIDFDQLFM